MEQLAQKLQKKAWGLPELTLISQGDIKDKTRNSHLEGSVKSSPAPNHPSLHYITFPGPANSHLTPPAVTRHDFHS